MKAVCLLTAMAGLAGTAQGADPTFLLEARDLTPYTRTYLGNGLIGQSSSQLGTQSAECFMAGVYDHAPGDVERLARLPEWNEVDVWNGRVWLNSASPGPQSIRSYRQTLNMYDGTLRTQYEWVDGDRAITIDVETFVSRQDAALGVVQVQITPHFAGAVKVRLPLRAPPPPKRYPLEKLEKLEGEAARNQWALWYPGYMAPLQSSAQLQGNGGLLQMLAEA